MRNEIVFLSVNSALLDAVKEASAGSFYFRLMTAKNPLPFVTASTDCVTALSNDGPRNLRRGTAVFSEAILSVRTRTDGQFGSKS